MSNERLDDAVLGIEILMLENATKKKTVELDTKLFLLKTFKWLRIEIIRLSSIRFCYNSKSLLYGIRSIQCNCLVLYTLEDNNRTHLVVHSVEKPSGSFVGLTEFQLVRNTRRKYREVQLNQHHPKNFFIENISKDKKRKLTITLHRTLYDPTTPIQPWESISGCVQLDTGTTGKSIFLG